MESGKQTISLAKAIGFGFIASRILVTVTCLVALFVLIPIIMNDGMWGIELSDYATMCLWMLVVCFLGGLIWAILDMNTALRGKVWVYRDTLLEAREGYRPPTVSFNGMSNCVVFKLYFKSLYCDFNNVQVAPMNIYFKAVPGNDYYIILFRGEVKNILDVEKYELPPSLMNRFIPDKQTLSQKLNWKFSRPAELGNENDGLVVETED